MAEIEYPKHILPKVGWRVGITGGEIRSLCENAVIGRRMDGPIEDYTEKRLGELCLKSDALVLDSIPNLSTNLLGTVFQYEDFRFKQKGEGKDIWDGSKETYSLINSQNYDIHTENMSVIGWNLIELDGVTFPYKRVFLRGKDYKEFKDKAEKSAEDIYLEEFEKLPVDDNKIRYKEMEGKIMLIHMPTNLNYWHFTIDLFPFEDKAKAIKNAKSSWREMMAYNVRDILYNTFLIISEDSDYPKIFNWGNLVTHEFE